LFGTDSVCPSKVAHYLRDGVFSRLARFDAQNPILVSISAKFCGVGCWDSSRLAPGRVLFGFADWWACGPVLADACFQDRGVAVTNLQKTVSQGSNLLPSTHLFVSDRLVFCGPVVEPDCSGNRTGLNPF
jgi:hypothetical protein